MSAGDAVLVAAVAGGMTGWAVLVWEVCQGVGGRLFAVSLTEPFVMLGAAVSRNGGCCGAGG